jgi:hypothetical protein
MAPATFPTHNLQIRVRATQERGGVSPPWLSITYARRRSSAQRGQSLRARPTCDGLRTMGDLTCLANLSTACQTMRWIVGCRRSECLNGFLHSRRDRAIDCGLWTTCSPNLSTACQTMRWIAGRRGSERLTGFVHGRRDRAIDCGGHAGGYNGHQREQCAERVGKCRLGGDAEHSADGAPARNV